jgi:hypothetical protein
LHENARKCSYFIDPIHFREFLEIFHFSPISINNLLKDFIMNSTSHNKIFEFEK